MGFLIRGGGEQRSSKRGEKKGGREEGFRTTVV